LTNKPALDGVNKIRLPGQTMDGGATSTTRTWKLHVAVFPAASVAVHVTVVTPSGKMEPGGGVHAVVTPGQLSLEVGTK